MALLMLANNYNIFDITKSNVPTIDISVADEEDINIKEGKIQGYYNLLLKELDINSIENKIIKYSYFENLSQDQILDKLNQPYMNGYEELNKKCLKHKTSDKVLYFK